MTSPLPAAPDGYEEPVWRHDTLDVLVVFDRNVADGWEDGAPLVERLGAAVSHELQMMNQAPFLAYTDDLQYYEDIPTQIGAVVTNDANWARWGQSWGARVVEVGMVTEGEVQVRSRGEWRTFDAGDVQQVARFIERELDPETEPAPDDDGTASRDRRLVDEPDSIHDLGLDLVLNDEFDAEGTALVGAAVEPLMSRVRSLLDEGAFAVDRGHDFGVEEEAERDLAELERQLRPLSGRPANPVLVQAYVAQLSRLVMEHASHLTRDAARARIEELRTGVVEKVARVDGSERDITNAIDALDHLAVATMWSEQSAPNGIDDEEWRQFVADASAKPRRTAASLVGWVPEGAAAVTGGATVGSATGFFAQTVAMWAATPTTTAAAYGLVAGSVGAVVGAILSVMAARIARRRLAT